MTSPIKNDDVAKPKARIICVRNVRCCTKERSPYIPPYIFHTFLLKVIMKIISKGQSYHHLQSHRSSYNLKQQPKIALLGVISGV